MNLSSGQLSAQVLFVVYAKSPLGHDVSHDREFGFAK